MFLRRSRNSSMSMCQVSRYAQTAPLRLPPWLTATAVSLATLRNGTTPWDSPLVPLMCAPIPRTRLQSLPRPPAVLREQRVVLDALEDPVQVVRHRGQEAGGELRPQRAGIEQRRRGAHEVKDGEQLVELDRPGLAVDLPHGKAHRDPHEEGLRQLVADAVLVQEVPVIERLQAEEPKGGRARGAAPRPGGPGRSGPAPDRPCRPRCHGR